MEHHMSQILPASINEPPGDIPTEAPVITALDPDGCTIGDTDFTLYISGENFFTLSVIHFAGHDEPTTLNADGTLSTGIKPSLWGDPVVVQVRVKNGLMASNAVDFEFRSPAVSRETSGTKHGPASGHGRGGRTARR
jgi:hypothetical protein